MRDRCGGPETKGKEMKITEDQMKWQAANDRFPPIKSQHEIDEYDKEVTRDVLSAVLGIVILFGLLIVLSSMPKWLPIVAAWWAS